MAPYYLPYMKVTLKLFKSETKTIDKDVFANADFWLLKGQTIHNKL